jgi:hypothetical protein
MKQLRILPLLLLTAVALFATTVIPVSVEQLARESTHVLLARAVDSRSEWNTEHTRIYTFTRFQTVRSMKGSMPENFTVKQLGGHAGGYTMKVAGVRGWQPGEDAVLFLRPSPKQDGTYAVTELMQGDFRLQRQPSGAVYVSNGVTGTRQMETSGKISEYKGSRMTLQELEQRVQKAGL